MASPGAPIGIPDAYVTFEGEALTVAAPGLVANDYDPEGDAFILSNFFQPANGTLTSIVTSGAFTYVPNAGFTGTDTFRYLLREQNTNTFSDPITVTITVGTPPPPDDACPPTLVISDFRSAPSNQEFIDLKNAGSSTIDFATVDCIVGAFTSTSYLGLPVTGTLASGATLRLPTNGALRDAYGGLALLDRESLPNGTTIAAIQPDIVTSLVYLANGVVYGFFHVDPAKIPTYCALYAGRLHPYAQGQCAAARAADGAAPVALGLAEMLEAAEAATRAAEVPTAYALAPVYPNPFRSRATLGVDVPEAAEVRVVVYDVLGRSVAVLMDEAVEAGRYEVPFDGSGLASGTYVVRMTAGHFVATRRLTIVR